MGVEFEQRLSPYSLGLACQESPLSIGEADSPIFARTMRSA
jgi:hypothetical protein